jgi:hypothetical protein
VIKKLHGSSASAAFSLRFPFLAKISLLKKAGRSGTKKYPA